MNFERLGRQQRVEKQPFVQKLHCTWRMLALEADGHPFKSSPCLSQTTLYRSTLSPTFFKSKNGLELLSVLRIKYNFKTHSVIPSTQQLFKNENFPSLNAQRPETRCGKKSLADQWSRKCVCKGRSLPDCMTVWMVCQQKSPLMKREFVHQRLRLREKGNQWAPKISQHRAEMVRQARGLVAYL